MILQSYHHTPGYITSIRRFAFLNTRPNGARLRAQATPAERPGQPLEGPESEARSPSHAPPSPGFFDATKFFPLG